VAATLPAAVEVVVELEQAAATRCSPCHERQRGGRDTAILVVALTEARLRSWHGSSSQGGKSQCAGAEPGGGIAALQGRSALAQDARANTVDHWRGLSAAADAAAGGGAAGRQRG
jgi:hypothetical protein